MSQHLLRAFLLYAAFFTAAGASAQNPLSGIVNVYTAVTDINCNDITVQSSAGFTPGSGVLIIQMKGATVDQTNTAASGDVIAYNGAGNYEIGWVQSVNGNSVILLNPLINSYDVNHAVQLVKVPLHNSAEVTATLQAQPWNGSTGGIIAVICTGTLTLSADVDASGTGYQGGAILSGWFGCNNQNYILSSAQAGYKGESIAAVVAGSESGKGKWASGGGGGNPGNSGGGGGGLGGNGGSGGNEYSGCSSTGVFGVGGASLTFNQNKAFLGGGGGGGYADNLSAVTPGTHGGGFVFIRAASLNGNGYTIKANGLDQTLVANDESAGGGGAGGSVYLDVQNYLSPVNVEVNGGKGGNTHNYTFIYDCHGPGGGGGGGVVTLAQATVPANVTIIATGGLPGLVTHPTSPCYNQSHGATAGFPGVTHFNLEVPESFLPLPEVSLGNDTTVCPDGSFVLTAPPGFTSYLWQDGSTEQSISVTAAGTYIVQVSSGAGCVASDTVIIDAPPLLSEPFLSDTVVCPYDVQTWSAPLTGIASYLWTDGTTNASIAIAEPGAYGVTLIDDNGCSASDNATLLHHPETAVELGDDLFACSGGSVDIEAPAGFVSYSWNTGQQSAAFSTTSQGVYAVTVTDGNGCTATDAIFFQNTPVTVLPIGDRTLCPPQTIQITAPPGYYGYQWSHNQNSQTTVIADPGTYALTVTDANGCSAADTFAVTAYCPPSLWFPNAFSPNGDGLNDRFSCICYHVTSYELRVYNRWGQLVFTSNDPDIGWNGMYKNQPCELGVYTYAVSYTFDDGVMLSRGVQSGNVLLLR